MGNCCSGASNEAEMNMMAGSFGLPTNKNFAGDLFDEREVMGLKGREKMRLVVKLQALFRGAIARKQVKNTHGFVARTFAGIRGLDGFNGETDYDNQRVQEIKQQLGPFVYPENSRETDGQIREWRPKQTLQNGAQYEGEWNVQSNKRD
jgi:hypothetical protein